MNIGKLLLLLIIYTVVLLIIDWSSVSKETLTIENLKWVFKKCNRTSSRGLRLLEQVQFLKGQRSFNFRESFVEYKNFHTFIDNLLIKMRSLGKLDLDSLDLFLKLVNCDVIVQRKIEDVSIKGYAQLTLIQIITCFFLYYVSHTLETPFSIGLIYILLLCFIFGIISYTLMLSWLNKKLLTKIDNFIFVCLGIKSYSNLNLPIKKVTELADVQSLYGLKFRNSAEKRLFEWLEKSIDQWRDQGVSISESLQQILIQATAHREDVQQKLSAMISFIMLLCLLFFGLVPFLVMVFQLISSQL